MTFAKALTRPVIVVTHAAFDPARRLSLARLGVQLRGYCPTIPWLIQSDDARRGSLWCWNEAMRAGLKTGATHVVWLPDDVTLCRDFGAILQAAIAARPWDVFDGFVNNAAEPTGGVRTPWLSMVNGYTGVVGCMPRALLEHHLEWRNRNRLGDYPNDAGVDLWAMATKRLIYKTAWSLAKHDTTLPSLDGHDAQPGVEREGLRFLDGYRRGVLDDLPNFLGRTFNAGHGGDSTACTHLPRTYAQNHLALIETLPEPEIETYYDVERGHGRDPRQREVFIAAPGYGGLVHAEWMGAVLRELAELKAAGVDARIDMGVTDSLINRARNRLVSNFLTSTATHLLFWDTDNFPTEPGHVVKMLDAGLDVVGAAVPLKNGDPKAFAFRWGKTGQVGGVMEAGCIPVDAVGTGLLLIRREVIVKMAAETHPLTYYRSGMGEAMGRPEWHLFADSVRKDEAGVPIHLSEDWEFCRRWKDLGGKVHLYPDADFIHYGRFPFTGSFNRAFPNEAP